MIVINLLESRAYRTNLVCVVFVDIERNLELVDKKCKVTELKGQYSEYFMKKIKITLEDSNLIDRSFKVIAENYSELSPNTEDGVRIDFEDAWVHMRKSNTEPIIRIFAEANSQDIANSYALKIKKEIKSISA